MSKQQRNLENIAIFSDGGARGNPGPAAIGYVIKDKQNLTIQCGKKYIGIATNNVAEYQAVVEALQAVQMLNNEHDIKTIRYYVDSQLIANQLMGTFKIKNESLKKLYLKVKELEHALGLYVKQNASISFLVDENSIQYQVIPREQNREADVLVNEALDERLL